MYYLYSKETFYSKNEDGDEWYGSCEYTDDELNQMQLLSPGWTVELKNLALKVRPRHPRLLQRIYMTNCLDMILKVLI